MKVLEVREAVLEFSNWTTEQQKAVLAVMDAQVWCPGDEIWGFPIYMDA